jgi:hypothetical protein
LQTDVSCRFDETEAASERAEATSIADLRGGAAKAVEDEMTEKEKKAKETVGAPAADNAMALKAAEALRSICGLALATPATPQERPVRVFVFQVILPSLPFYCVICCAKQTCVKHRADYTIAQVK